MSTYTVQKQLLSALGIKTFAKQAIAKLAALFLFSVFIVSCIGTSNVPVTYHVPTNDSEFTPATFKPSVEFPNGLPAQSNVTIRLNGADITDDFNDWGVGLANHARVTLTVNDTNTPLIWGALRDGRNTFQVLVPNKAMVTFNMDMPSMLIHVTDVSDGWQGNRSVAKRGNMYVQGYLEGEEYASITSMRVQIASLDANGNEVYSTANGRDMTARPGDTSKYPAGCTMNTNPDANPNKTCFFLQMGSTAVTLGDFEFPEMTAAPNANYQYTNPTGWTGAGIVENGSAFGNATSPVGDQAGFIQTTGNLSTTFNIVTPDSLGYSVSFYAAQRPGNTQTLGIYVDGVQKGTATPTSSTAYTLHSVNVGKLTAGSHTLEFRGLNPLGGDNTAFIDEVKLVNRGPYTFTFNAYDETGTVGTTSADMVKITVCDSEGCSSKKWLRSNIELYDTRLNNDGVFSIGFDQIALKSTGTGIANMLDTMNLSFSDMGGCEGGCAAGFNIVINNLQFENSSVNLDTPVQNSSTTTRIDVDADLHVESVGGGSYARVYALWIPITCNINRASNAASNPIQFDTDLTLATDGSSNTVATFNNNNLVLGGLDLGGCTDIASFFIDILKEQIVDFAGGIIEDMMNVDLPKLRMVVRIGDEVTAPVPGSTPYNPGTYSLYGTELFALDPRLASYFGLTNGYAGTPTSTWDITWGVNLGFHLRGQGPERIPAMGSLYESRLVDRATLAYGTTNAEKRQSRRTLGAGLTENFLNQLFLGLWESGLIYIDLDFTGDMGPNALLENVNFQFASAQPWEFDILDDANPKGDVLLTIPDLTIALVGDVHYPEELLGYEFAYMLADLQVYLDLEIAPGNGALRLQSASAVEVTVKSISSDWDGTTEDQMIGVFDTVLTYLTGSGAWDLPFPDILDSEVEFGDVWSDDGQLNVTIDVYNGDMYPKGPGVKATSWTAYNGSQSYGSYDSLENNVDDTAGNSFHFTARARSQTRDCTASNQWGCTTYSVYYWTEHQYEWGFGFKTLRSNVITAVSLDGRNDCCDTRANGIEVRLYNAGALVHTAAALTSGTGTGLRTVAIPNITADEVRLMVKRSSTVQCTAFTPAACPVSAGDKIGNVGDGGRTMNFSEVTITTAN